MVRVGKTVVTPFLLGCALWAQSFTPVDPASDDRAPSDAATIAFLAQQVKDLQAETKELRERLKAMEDGQTNAQPVAQVGGAANPALEPAQTSPPPAAASPQPGAGGTSPGLIAELHDLHGIRWRGFGEVDYKVLDQREPETGTYGFVPGSAGNFYTGDFGLFLTSRLSDRASVLSEIVFEEGDAQSYNVDLRRVLLNYDYNDHLKISFGRYQTDIGYYNWAFRSAAWPQTTADGPLVMEFRHQRRAPPHASGRS